MTKRLPDADWIRRVDLERLVAALGADEMRYVGGAVRDTLLGLPVRDVDVATVLIPDEVTARLEGAGLRVVPTGLAHGTVTAVLPQGPVEITTLRRDVATDGRHAVVAFATEWNEDAARRDFTINALYAHPETGEISDYFNGLADLEARCVRFIGEAEERIREDHLRILRYFRFQSRFGSLPADVEAEAACKALAPSLKGLSRERVGAELLALLALPDPAPTVARMAALGVLEQALPEANASALAPLIAAENEAGIKPDPMRRLAALLPTDSELAKKVAARLRLSNAQKKRLVTAADRNQAPSDPRAIAYRLGIESALDCLLLAGRSTGSLEGWEPPELPLKGGEIVARGVAAGPEVARVLQTVESRWIEEGFPSRERVLELLELELSNGP